MNFSGRAFPANQPGDGMFSTGILGRWPRELNDIPVGKLFAKSLLAADDERCPNAKSLSPNTRVLLRYVISPGE